MWLRQLIEMCATETIEQPSFMIDNALVHTNLRPEEEVKIVQFAPFSYLLNPIELLCSALNI